MILHAEGAAVDLRSPDLDQLGEVLFEARVAHRLAQRESCSCFGRYFARNP